MIPKTSATLPDPLSLPARKTAAAPAAPAERFQQVLRRLSREAGGDAAEPHDDDDERQALPLPTALPAPALAALPPAVPPVSSAPSASAARVAEAQAGAAVQRRLAEPVAAVTPSHWQLELSATGMAPQQLEVQRSAAGGLQVVVTGTEPPPAAQQERLRQRIAARGHAARFRGEGER